MEQFSIEKYLQNPNRPVVTRDGRSARILCGDRINNNRPNFPVIALIRRNDVEEIKVYTKDGKYYEDMDDNLDLFFAPKKKEGWVNIYRTTSGNQVGEIYNSKEDAETLAKDCEKIVAAYVATIKIEWEE